VRFPLPFIRIKSYKGGNGFGASRDKVREGLSTPLTTSRRQRAPPVLAMDDGVVINGPYSFYSGTYALEIKHPQFIARYG
jgi:hypothetical protein